MANKIQQYTLNINNFKASNFKTTIISEVPDSKIQVFDNGTLLTEGIGTVSIETQEKSLTYFVQKDNSLPLIYKDYINYSKTIVLPDKPLENQ